MYLSIDNVHMKIFAEEIEFIVIILTNLVDSGEKETRMVGCDLCRKELHATS